MNYSDNAYFMNYKYSEILNTILYMDKKFDMELNVIVIPIIEFISININFLHLKGCHVLPFRQIKIQQMVMPIRTVGTVY